MPDPQATFTTNRSDVAAKVIDGELIIIRLSDGTYYSMDNVGTCVWELIDAGHDLTAVVRIIADWYDVPAEQVVADVDSLVGALLAEQLIVASPPGLGAIAGIAPPSADARVYATPGLSIYRDMGNLLALDPPTPGIDDLLFRDASAH